MTGLRHCLPALFAATVWFGTVVASEFGTPEQARALLERAVVALQKDRTAALDAFSRKDSGFQDRDLYVFCGGPDGKLSAHPKYKGAPMRRFKDFAGNAFGEEMYEVATEGKFSQVKYLAMRRGELHPRRKTSLITKVDDQICGVGYFEDAPASSRNLAINDFEGVFIYGYDPVAYFTMDKPVKGSAEFAHEYLGADWHFVNAEHRRMFAAQPIKYIPQHGGFCSSGASGATRMSAANPRAWRIIEGKLYLFAGTRLVDGYNPDAPEAVAANADWQKKLMDLVSQ